MAGGLDAFIVQVQSITKSKGASSQLAELIRRACAPKGVLTQTQTQHLDEALQTLDLQQHSAAIAAILRTKIRAAPSNNANLLAVIRAQILEFVSSCDSAQIQLIPDIYCSIFRKLTVMLLQKNEPASGIEILSKAIDRLQAHPAQLTSIHPDLCCLCLKARNLKPALKYLDENVDDILKENTGNPGFDVKAFLCYYYYGGMIYTALHNYERALFFLEVCLTTPATVHSAIMVEAYKKHLLVSLIHRGKVPQLPAYRSACVQRSIRPACQPYVDLAEAITTSAHARKLDAARCQQVLHREVFTRDNNYGLVKIVIDSVIRSNIRRLTNTFLTLSLTDVAHRCQLAGADEAEHYLVSMIGDNQISATIDQANGMVSFHDANSANTNIEQQVVESVEECLRLEKKLSALDTKTLLNPQFVGRATKTGTGGAGSMFTHDDEGISFGGATSDMFGGI